MASSARYTEGYYHIPKRSDTLADTQTGTLANDKLYKAEYVGSGTFLITKPKRKKTKQRQSNLKNTTRGSRK